MKSETFIIQKGGDLSKVVALMAAVIKDKPLKVTVAVHQKRRSEQQNRLLWSLYADIIRIGGEAMRGWDTEDLHELFLGEHFGWTEMRVGKHRRKKPARRSSGLNTQEFSDFVDFIVRYMAEQGVVLHLPGDLP